MQYHEINLKYRQTYVITLAGGVQIAIGSRRSEQYGDGKIAITAPRTMPIEREEIHHTYAARRAASNGTGTHATAGRKNHHRRLDHRDFGPDRGR